MTTAEKRADLEAQGEAWPDCECHAEPMKWQRNLALDAGGRFVCRIKSREWRKQHRAKLKERGLCVHCQAPAVTLVLCGRCAEEHSTREEGPRVQLRRRAAQMKYRQQKRAAAGFRPTGAGRAAFAAWTKGPGTNG